MQSSAETAGQFVGMGIVFLIPLIAIVLNGIALWRRGTNAKCALAIIGALLAIMLFSFGGLGSRVGHVPPVVLGTLGLAGLAAIITSTVLAIIGLVEFSRRRRHIRGRKRAITALVLNGIFFTIMGFGAVKGFNQGRALRDSLKPTAPAGAVVTNDAWNFRLEPPAEWSQIDPTAFGPLIRTALGRHHPEMYSLVLAENLPSGAETPLAGAMELSNCAGCRCGRGAETPLAGAMELVKHSLRGTGPVEFLAEEEKMDQGRLARTLESRSRGPSSNYFYVHWMTQNNGTVYRVVTWGADAEAARVREEARRMAAGFRIIDPLRNALGPAEVATSVFASPKFGYSLDLRGTQWTRRWANLETESPSAEFGVLNAAGTGGLAITPVWIGDAEVPLDTLTRALLSRMEIPFPSDQIYGDKACNQNLVRGRALAYERSVNGQNFVYRARILAGRGYAYLLIAWMSKASSPFTDHLDEAMDRVVFPDLVAPNPALQTDRERETHALIYNEIGLGHDQAGRLDEAATWFRRAFETTRPNPIILTNYVQVCLRNGQAKTAVAYLDSVLDRFPGNQKLGALRATAQYQAGDVDGSLRSYAALFAGGWKNDTEFSGYVRELAARADFSTALAAIEQYAGGAESPLTRRLRAQLLVSKGDPDQAISQLTVLRDETPSDVETSLTLVDAYFAAKRPADVLGECERLANLRGESVDILHRQGLAEFSLKRYREAKKTFEKALAKSPANPEIQRLVDAVSGMLGEGSNSLVKTPIEPVAIPDALRPAVKADSSDEYLRGYSAWYRYAVRAISFQRGQEFKITEAQMIEIRDQQGVEKFSSLEFPFDPLGEEIFVNVLTVRDAAGEVISQGKVEDSYVIDQGTDQTAAQGKILHVPVAGLRPGCTVETVVTRRETGPAKVFSFQHSTLAKGLPVLHSSLRVQAPSDSIHWESASGVPAPKREESSFTWTIEKPAVYRWEPLQALPDTFLPMVWIGDATATWAREGQDYLELIKERLAPDEKVRAAAAKTLEGLTTPAARTAALARFVQREIAYKAIEFGRRARVPNPAEQTLRAKYGDCKDHAVLLAQLLASAGIEARLALVNSGGDLRSSLPSLDQFDHMIVYLPGGKGGRFLDCTGKNSDLRVDPPAGLASRRAFILDPAAPRLQPIPPYPTESSIIESERDVSFSSERDVEVKEHVRISGIFAAGLRSSLLAIEPPQRLRQLQRIMAGAAPALDLANAEFTGLDDPQAALELRLRYTLRDRFQLADDRLVGQLPAIWERLYISADADVQRFTPFQIWIPARLHSQCRVTLPPGWQVTAPRTVPAETPYFEGSTKASIAGDVLRVESTLHQRAGSFAPGQYRDYLTAARQTRALAEQGLALKRAPR